LVRHRIEEVAMGRFLQLVAVLLASFVLLLFSTNGDAHQDERKGGPEADDGGNWRVVTRWVAERPIGVDGYQLIGEYETNAEAERACKEWSDAHPEILRLTRTREVKTRVRDVRSSTPKPKPDEPALSGPKAAMPKAASKRLITVTVSKFENGRWVEQPSRKVQTTDQDKAKNYYNQVNAVQGWRATTDPVDAFKTNEAKEAKPYNPPGLGSPEPKGLRPYGATLKTAPKPASSGGIAGTTWFNNYSMWYTRGKIVFNFRSDESYVCKDYC
jgi:hypothetical protein